MLTTIGHRPAATDVVSALLECHERIRYFAALAVSVGERPDLAAEEVRDACARVARYFGDALPLHVRDEEDSLLPRLTGKSPELDAALAEMHEQHETHRLPLRRLIDLCAKLKRAPEHAVRSELGAVAHDLDRDFRQHLAMEEARLFPAITVHIPVEEQAAMLVELRSRRQTK